MNRAINEERLIAVADFGTSATKLAVINQNGGLLLQVAFQPLMLFEGISAFCNSFDAVWGDIVAALQRVRTLTPAACYIIPTTTWLNYLAIDSSAQLEALWPYNKLHVPSALVGRSNCGYEFSGYEIACRVLELKDEQKPRYRYCDLNAYISVRLADRFVTDVVSGFWQKSLYRFDDTSANMETLRQLGIVAAQVPRVVKPLSFAPVSAAFVDRYVAGAARELYIAAGTTDTIGSIANSGARSAGDIIAVLGSVGLVLGLQRPLRDLMCDAALYDQGDGLHWLCSISNLGTVWSSAHNILQSGSPNDLSDASRRRFNVTALQGSKATTTHSHGTNASHDLQSTQLQSTVVESYSAELARIILDSVAQSTIDLNGKIHLVGGAAGNPFLAKALGALTRRPVVALESAQMPIEAARFFKDLPFEFDRKEDDK